MSDTENKNLEIIKISDYAYRYIGKYSERACPGETYGYLIGLKSQNLIYTILPVAVNNKLPYPSSERLKYIEPSYPYMKKLLEKFSLDLMGYYQSYSILYQKPDLYWDFRDESEIIADLYDNALFIFAPSVGNEIIAGKSFLKKMNDGVIYFNYKKVRMRDIEYNVSPNRMKSYWNKTWKQGREELLEYIYFTG